LGLGKPEVGWGKLLIASSLLSTQLASSVSSPPRIDLCLHRVGLANTVPRCVTMFHGSPDSQTH
jgi:hypothetical protein